MVRCIKGTLIQTEASIREVILSLSEPEDFIIEDIDDNNVFITREAASNIKERVYSVINRQP